MASIPIGELLVDNGQITPEELEQAEAENKKTGEPIASVLAKLGFITENSLKNALELQYGVMYMNLSKREPDEELISMLPEKMIREQQAVPVAHQGERLTVAMVDPNDSAALSEIQKTLNGKQVKAVVCLEEQFVKFVDRAFHVEEKTTNGNGSAPSNGAEPKSEPEAKSDGMAESGKSADEAIIGTVVEPKAESAPEVKTESASESKTESTPEAKTESAPESKTESAPESKPEAAPEAKTEAAPESKTESAPESKTESAPEAKTESAPEAKAESKTESAPEVKAEAAPETKTESATGAAPAAGSDAAAQSGAEAALALSRAETAIAKAEAGLAKAETAIAKAQSEPSQPESAPAAPEAKTDSTMYSDQPAFDTQEMKARPDPNSGSGATATTESTPAATTESAAAATPESAPAPATESVTAPTSESAPANADSEQPKDEEPAPKSEADLLTETDLAKRAQEEAIVLLANQILGSAIKRHCSNIHITMGPRESLVKYRLNGRLMVDRKLPNTIVVALVARYKMMARLNLAERKEPQDGHIKVKSAAKEIVCLISVVPQDHGENVVIWIV